MNDLKAGIEKILDLAPVQEMDLEGRKYTDRAIRPVLQPLADTLTVGSLEGLIDFVNAEMCSTDGEMPNHIIHIEDYRSVSIKSRINGPFRQREVLLRANAIDTEFRFGRYYGAEDFIISLQAEFYPTKTLAKLLAVAGNVEVDTSVGIMDDGVSQTATGRTGIARKGDVTLPREVKLQPYHTFPEVEQPEIHFVFRIRKGDENNPIAFGLFEADGNRWRLQAAQNIKEYLHTNLPQANIIS